MNRFIKAVSTLLTVCMLFSVAATPVYAMGNFDFPAVDGDVEDQPLDLFSLVSQDNGANENTSSEDLLGDFDDIAWISENRKDAEFYESDNIPLYWQNNYPDTPYGCGTVATSGCGITCLAMVATYLLDDPTLTPDVLAEQYGTCPALSNAHRMEMAAEGLGLTYRMALSREDIIDSLRDGCIIIALMGSNSIWTDYQHFVLLTGINEEGRFTVNDPSRRAYQRYELQTGFLEGFNQIDIFWGLSGGWIFETQREPISEDIVLEPSKPRDDFEYVEPNEEEDTEDDLEDVPPEAPVESEEPEDQMDPTIPSEPVEDTEPTVPSEPTEPTEPVEPSEPIGEPEATEPTEPSEPATEPSEPAQPSEPSNSPDTPAESEPGEDSETESPLEPAPTEPVSTEQTTSEPAISTEPTEPVVPAETTAPPPEAPSSTETQSSGDEEG